VFYETLHAVPALADADALLERWTRLRALRAPVRKKIEALRAEGKVGSSLQAEADYRVAEADRGLLASLGDDLRFVLLTSAVRVRPGDAAGDTDAAVEVSPSAHAKCERCWHYTGDVGADQAHPQLCARCVTNLYGAGEVRRYA
jgi:isoleucyl-tRNA synthetase